MSFSLTFTVTRTLNFGQGELLSVGAMIGVTVLLLLAGGGAFHALPFDASAGWRYPLALLISAVLSGLISIAVFYTAVRPFVGRSGLNWVVSTIGFGIVLQNLGLLYWGAQPINVPAPFGDDVLRIFGAGVRSQELLVIAVAVVISVGYELVLRHTLVGKAMLAVAHSPSVASLMGINVPVVMLGAFAVSGAIAGIAGVLVAPIATASIFMGVGFGLKAFSAAIIGGLNNARGCILGGLGLGLLESFVGLWDAQWREISVFVLIIVVLAIRPNGLFGSSTAIEKV